MTPSISQPGTRTPSPSYRTHPPVPVHASAIADNVDSDSEEEDGYRSRTSSSKRRKRAPRGNKSQPASAAPQGPPAAAAALNGKSGEISSAAQYAAIVVNELRLKDLAEKSQMVARQASQIVSQKTPPATSASLEPSALTTSDVTVNIIPATPAMNSLRSTPELRKKKSNKWTDIFKRDSASDQEIPTAAEISAMEGDKEELLRTSSPPPLSTSPVPSGRQTSTARNVTNLIMGLNSKSSSAHLNNQLEGSIDLSEDVNWSGNGSGHARSSSVSSRGRRKDRKGLDRESLASVSTSSTSNSWARGQSAPSNDRRARSRSPTADAALAHFNMLVPSAPSTPHRPPVPPVPETYRSSVPVPVTITQQQQQDTEAHLVSTTPPSNRRSYAPSIASVSTSTTSSSAFTAFSGKKGWRNSGSSRYSHSSASVRSVSTAATSVSSGSMSWRRAGQPPLPATNIKVMDGVPWELNEMPRQMSHRPKEHTFAPVPTKKNRRPPSAPTSPTPGSSF
ncbi:hypothetical protein FRB91_007514, partial [Serendipita sp. 411]